MSWSRTGTRVRRGLKDVLRSGVAGARGTGWRIAKAIAPCGGVGGLVIIAAVVASPSLYWLDLFAAAAQESPLGDGAPRATGDGRGRRSVKSAERTYVARGTAPVRAASKPPTTKIAGDASWEDTPVTSRFEADANYTVCFVPGEDCERSHRSGNQSSPRRDPGAGLFIYVDADREGSCQREAAGSECPGNSR